MELLAFVLLKEVKRFPVGTIINLGGEDHITALEESDSNEFESLLSKAKIDLLKEGFKMVSEGTVPDRDFNFFKLQQKSKTYSWIINHIGRTNNEEVPDINIQAYTGDNGTGKSTIFDILNTFISDINLEPRNGKRIGYTIENLITMRQSGDSELVFLYPLLRSGQENNFFVVCKCKADTILPPVLKKKEFGKFLHFQSIFSDPHQIYGNNLSFYILKNNAFYQELLSQLTGFSSEILVKLQSFGDKDGFIEEGKTNGDILYRTLNVFSDLMLINFKELIQEENRNNPLIQYLRERLKEINSSGNKGYLNFLEWYSHDFLNVARDKNYLVSYYFYFISWYLKNLDIGNITPNIEEHYLNLKVLTFFLKQLDGKSHFYEGFVKILQAGIDVEMGVDQVRVREFSWVEEFSIYIEGITLDIEYLTRLLFEIRKLPLLDKSSQIPGEIFTKQEKNEINKCLTGISSKLKKVEKKPFIRDGYGSYFPRSGARFKNTKFPPLDFYLFDQYLREEWLPTGTDLIDEVSQDSISGEIRKFFSRSFNITDPKVSRFLKNLTEKQLHVILRSYLLSTNIILKSDDREFSMDEMSDGEKILFQRLFLLGSKISSENESKNDTIFLLIDEPEVHLHLEWQRRFISVLLNFLYTLPKKKMRVLLSTHSPFILMDISKESVIFLKRNENGKTLTYSQRKIFQNNNRINNTFGGNIVDVIQHGFFLEDLFGVLVGKAAKEISTNEIWKERLSEIRNLIGDAFTRMYLFPGSILHKNNLKK